MFCFRSILQIWIVLIGFRDTNCFMNLGICEHEFKFTCRGYCRFTLNSIGFRDTNCFMNLGICEHEFKFTCRGYCRFTLNSTKSLLFDMTTILLPKRLIFIYCLIAKALHYQSPFTELKLSN